MCDLSKDNLGDTIPCDTVDLVTMFFVLSAVSPEKMNAVLQNVLTVSGVCIWCVMGGVIYCECIITVCV